MRKGWLHLLAAGATAGGLSLGLAGPAGAASEASPGGTTVMPAATAASCANAPDDANCDGVPPGSPGAGCWDSTAYEVPFGNPDTVGYYDLGTGWYYTISLWYSPTCKTNWSVAQADGSAAFAPGSYSTKVWRYAGPDGPYLMEHAGSFTGSPGTSSLLESPMVYSPNNQAQSCLSLPPFTGNADQMVCTLKW